MQKNGMNILPQRRQRISVRRRKKILFLVLFLFISMTGCSQIKEQNNQYLQCVNKIWIPYDIQADERFERKFHFFIQKIEEDHVEGYYSTFFDILDIEDGISDWYFTGYIEDSKINCKLWFENKEVGSMVIEYIAEDRLNADVEFHYEDTEFNSESIYKVYNIKDLKETDIILDYGRAVDAELDKQGKVQMIPGLLLNRHTYPVAFITNEQGDILYQLSTGFHTGSRIEEFRIYDMNGDGLEDIEVVTYFGKDYIIEPFHWGFYQDENGTFYQETAWQEE